MKFLSIVKKEMLHNIRDKRAMFLMIIFPILLIVILGAAFSSSFNSSNIIRDVKVSYKINDEGKLGDSFIGFTKSISKELDISFEPLDDEEIAKDKLREGLYDSFIILNKNEMKIYVNNLRIYNANLIETMMRSFIDKSKLIAQVIQTKPQAIDTVLSTKGYAPVFTENKSIIANNIPSSKDYYSITMFTMIILYSTNIGAFAILSEKIRKTYQRVMSSNIQRITYIMAKVISCFIVTSLQVLIVYLFSKYILGANWGSEPIYILLISASLIFMAVSVGVGLGEGVKNPAIMAAVLNMTIPVFVFLAGGYVPLSIFNSNILNKIAELSPLKWTNQAMFNLIYFNDLGIMAKCIIINLFIGVLFLLVPVINSFARKDVV
ncbi:ABC transporter permease [Clostridiaceae bacterium M8S5]|nr:ABC transporter permease [Clostridiaceae bacterium M8S5]